MLDTPSVNAFATLGGYVYVTRGLVALAGDEAQLAGVIAHEIDHVVAGHSALRQERGTAAGLGLLAGAIGLAVLGVDPQLSRGIMDIGQTAAGGILAGYSRGDELDADNLGVRYLARAGYDPYAQADFLASHPATGPRTRQAIQVAEAVGAVGTAGADRNRDRFLAEIDDMVYGDSATHGFVDGRTFSHPKLRFTFTNSAKAVVAKGPANSHFILDGGRDRGGRLTDYVAGVWVPGIARNHRTGQLSALRSQRINGVEAASAVLPVRLGNRTYDALLVAYRHDGKLYRITGLAPRGSGLMPAMQDAARSFRRLSAAEAAGLRQKRIRIVTVRRGDTAAGLAGRMNVDSHALERFRVLNGLRPGAPLRAGERVKIVR